MNDPASHRSDGLIADGSEDAGASFLRRTAPALSFCALLLACLIALTIQTLKMIDLRCENTAMRAATANLEQLRQENEEMERLRAAARQAEGAQKEQEELEKLRAEVDQLRAVAQELPVVRAESQRLAAERAEAAAKAGVVAEVDPFAEAKQRNERLNCINNIKQIVLAARIWRWRCACRLQWMAPYSRSSSGASAPSGSSTGAGRLGFHSLGGRIEFHCARWGERPREPMSLDAG